MIARSKVHPFSDSLSMPGAEEVQRELEQGSAERGEDNTAPSSGSASESIAPVGPKLAAPSHPVAGVAPEQSMRQSLGFANREELMAASKEVRSNDGRRWWVTALPSGEWAAWNETDYSAVRHTATEEEAIREVPRDSEISGSSLLT